MGSIRVAIIGVGNCASSLVQGVHYYRDAAPDRAVPGLMHVQFGDYHVRDIEFVAAFDVDAKKVGRDLAEAITASENNTITICDVPPLGVTVQRGPTLDGLGKYYRETITESDADPVDVTAALRDAKVDVVVKFGGRVVVHRRIDNRGFAAAVGPHVVEPPEPVHVVCHTHSLPYAGRAANESDASRQTGRFGGRINDRYNRQDAVAYFTTS